MKKYLFITLLVCALLPQPAWTQATDPFLGEIHIFAGNFAPKGWAFCEGQLLSIAQNTALFSLLGTTYGGNGTTNFALPDLRGRVPIHTSNDYTLGQAGGAETVTLTQGQLPMHSHGMTATSDEGSLVSPSGAVYARARGGVPVYGDQATGQLSGSAISGMGGGQPHNNLQPYLALNYIIALQGVFPARPQNAPKNGKTVNGADPMIGQVILVPFTFAPNGWADCNGQLVAIADNEALFALLGTTYGGDGVTTFALPDLRGRVPVHIGATTQLGQTGGEATHTLTASEMPSHSHNIVCAVSPDLAGPADAYASRTENALMMYGASGNGTMNGAAVTVAGSSQPHENMKPYLTIRYVIATVGIFPSRN